MSLPGATRWDGFLAALVVVALAAVGQGARHDPRVERAAPVSAPPVSTPAPAPAVTPISREPKVSSIRSTARDPVPVRPLDPAPAMGTAPRWPTLATLLADQQRALTTGDAARFVETLAPNVVGFGTAAGDYGEDRTAVAAFVRRDLRSPARIATTHIGERPDHAWIARQLAVGRNRYVVLQVAALVDGSWTIVASHWGTLVTDASVLAAARAGTLPQLTTIEERRDEPVEVVERLRRALSSPRALADAFSASPDAIYVGSAPGEWLAKGSVIKRWWNRSRAALEARGGMRVRSESSWVPARTDAPRLAVACFDADLQGTTGVSVPYRVLAVVERAGDSWVVVAAQWSVGGPVPVPAPENLVGEALGPDDSSPGSDDDGLARLEQAQDAYAAGDFAAAKRAAEQALASGTPGAAVLAAMATCKLGDVPGARARAMKLRGADQARFRAACPDADAESPTEELVDPYDASERGGGGGAP